MPRFYFHVCNGNGFDQDEEGQELPNVEAARLAAVRHARSIMAGDVRRGILDLSSFVEIEDESKQLVETLCFAEALDMTKRH
jgi:hypothetical protein